jgi:hypothetical protein
MVRDVSRSEGVCTDGSVPVESLPVERTPAARPGEWALLDGLSFGMLYGDQFGWKEMAQVVARAVEASSAVADLKFGQYTGGEGGVSLSAGRERSGSCYILALQSLTGILSILEARA